MRLLRILNLPPHVLLRRIRHRMGQIVRRTAGRWRARLFDTHISDARFRAALARPLEDGDDLSASLHYNDRPAFFIAPSQAGMLTSALRQDYPEIEALTIAAADQVCDHGFDLLGSGPVSLGASIDWHTDFKTGHRWDPDEYYADIYPAPYPGGYDIKVPWELSRCHHFAWLGQAYWFTADERYAQEFAAEVQDWIGQNPPQLGVNWACAMEVAIRAVNWLWGYFFFKDSPSLSAKFRLVFSKSLLAHGRHIMDNLEWSASLTTNHYLANVVGLVYLGVLLPEFKEARRWREFGLQELEKEMFKQVYPDGVDFEASVSYHRLATELFLSAVVLAQLNGHTFSESFMDRLEKMLKFTMYVTKADGTAPLIGDNDNGRLHRLKVWKEPEREWIDHRYLLAIGAVLFERQAFAQAAGDQWEEAIWLLGQRVLSFKRALKTAKLPPLQLGSRAFPDAGLYILRHGEHYLAIDAGPVGQNGRGGHAHNDTLSLELYANGQTWIVDPGTFVYTADYEARNRFRSTSRHNLVTIDGQEISCWQEDRLFELSGDNSRVVNLWTVTDRYDYFEGEHDSYRSPQGRIVHRRGVYLDKVCNGWIVVDHLAGQGVHELEYYLHFAGSAQAYRESQDRIRVKSDSTELLIVLARPKGLILELEPGDISPGYGTRTSSLVLRAHKSAALPERFYAVFLPITEEQTIQPRLRDMVKNHLSQLNQGMEIKL